MIKTVHHDFIAGYVANEHIDHTTVSVIAGTLLTGGGNIASDVTLNVDEGSIDHGNIAGLGDDDHTQYLLVDGTRAMTGGLSMGNNAITLCTGISGADVDIEAGTGTINTSGFITGGRLALNANIYIDSSGPSLILYTGNSPRLTLGATSTLLAFLVIQKSGGNVFTMGPDGANQLRINVDAGGIVRLLATGSEIYFNNGGDVDFRVVAVGQANALFVQGSNGYVGINNNAPSMPLDVTGDIQASGIVAREGHYFAYASAEIAGVVAWTTLDLDTVVEADANCYSEAAGVVTIQKDGLYKIGYHINFDLDGGIRHYGIGGISIDGAAPLEYSKAASYSRITTFPGTSAVNTIIVSLNATQTVELQAFVASTDLDIGGFLTNPASMYMEYIKDDS